MPRWVQFAAACRLFVALTSAKLMLDGNPTSYGKAVVLLSQGALALRTTLALFRPHCNRLCGWLSAVGLALNVLMVHSMASTVQNTLAGTTPASRQTQDFVVKVVQHCETGVGYITSSYLMIDQAFGRLVLPEWAVLLMAQLQFSALLRVHASSLPSASLLVPVSALQFVVVILPWLVRKILYKQEQSSGMPTAAQVQQHTLCNTTAVLAGTCCSHDASPMPEKDTCCEDVSTVAPPADNSGAVGTSAGNLGSSCASDCGSAASTDCVTPACQAQLALQAAQSLVLGSHRQQKKAVKPYVSVLGPVTLQPLCIKIDTPALEPDNLPAAATQLMEDALTGAFHRLGEEVVLLGMSVRHGCILLALQTLQPHVPRGMEACDAALKLAQQLLPGLLSSLCLAPDACALAQPMGPGTSMSLQRGKHLVQAVYQPGTGKWCLENQTKAFSQWQGKGGEVLAPELGLVRVIKQVDLAHSHAPASGRDASGSSGVRAYPSVSVAADSKHSTVVLEVVVGCSPYSAGQLTVCTGAAAHSHKVAAVMAEDRRGLQLCVLGEEGYLPASLIQQTLAEDSSHIVAQMEVELDTSGLVQHHPGGPDAALQPITLQLWCGKLLLGSSHTLLGLGPAPGPPRSTGTAGSTRCSSVAGGITFGWWGVEAAVAVAAAGELQDELQRAAGQGLRGEGGEHAAALQELLRDVCLWLAGVRHMACSGGWCACPASGRAQLGLPHAQMLLLADSLSQFAASRGLSAMHRMIQQQACIVRGPQHPVSIQTALHTGGLSAGLQVWFRLALGWVRIATLGHTCAMCEQLQAGQMYNSLAQASICISMLTGFGAVVIIWRQSNSSSQMFVAWGLACWGVLHLCLSVVKCMVVRRKQLSASKSLWIIARVLSLTVFVSKMITTLSTVLGFSQRMDAMRKQHQAGTWVFMHLIHVVSDRLQLQGVVPRPAITALACIEFIVIVLINRQQHSWMEATAGSAFAVLLFPLLIDLYARSHTVAPASSTHGLQHSKVGHDFAGAPIVGAECSFDVGIKGMNSSLRARK